jgi:hypothetical protein
VLLLKGGDRRCRLLELEVLLLHNMLKVYDRMGASVNNLTSGVELLAGVIPPTLGLAKAAVHDLQLIVLVRRRKCTNAENGILIPQVL